MIRFNLSDKAIAVHNTYYKEEDIKEFMMIAEDKSISTKEVGLTLVNESWVRISDLQRLAGDKLVESSSKQIKSQTNSKESKNE